MKTKLTICALTMAACWVSPAALAQGDTAIAGKPAAPHHAKRQTALKHSSGMVLAAAESGKAMSGGDSNAVPPPPPAAAEPPPAAAAPPPSPPVPVIPDSLLQPVSSTEIRIGTQWLTGHNTAQAGRYDGFTTSGLDFLLGFDVHHRDGWNSGDTSYFDISGANLDFQTGSHLSRGFRDNAFLSDVNGKLGPEAEVDLSFGNQGKWGVTARYNAITYAGNYIQSLWTVNNGVGYLNNGLLPSGGASNNPLTPGAVTSWTATALAPKFLPLQTGTRRDQIEVSGKLQLDEWTFTTNVQHEHKQGSLEESVRETYGGMAFTLPVDYDTDRFDVSASYVDPDYQALIQYTYSHFTDNNLGVALPYVVSKASLNASSGPYAQTAFYSTPPSNSAHYVTAMFSDKLAPQTRLVFNGRVGLELQDTTFAPNSADPYLSNTMGNPTYHWFDNLNSLNQGTGVSSLDASAFVYQARVSLSSGLAEHLDGRATYSIDGRDVSTDAYKVWMGAASIDAQANSAFYSVVQNWVKQNANVELNYLLIPESSTKLTASYTFNDTSRTNAQVEHSITNTESVQLSSMIGKDLLGRVTYEHANRSGTMHYGTAWGNLETGAPEEEGTPSGAYYQAPMTSDAVTVRADYAPQGDLSGGIFFKFADNRYHYAPVESAATPTNAGEWNLVGMGQGLYRDYNLTVGPDVNYRPSDNVNLHAYYAYERIYFDNRGNGACAESNTGNCAGSAGYFQNTYTSDMHTAGVSGDWKVSDQLKLTGEYNMSYGSVIFGQYNGVMVSTVTQSYQNVVPYPDIDSSMHDFKVAAIYQFTDNIDGSLIYRYSMFNNNDWQYVPSPVITTTDSSTAISIVNAGYGPPNYNVSSIGMVVRMKL